VVVVGAGIMGLSTAKALSELGQRVIVVERFELDHDRGSSHGNARGFKLTYPDPEFVRLAQTSLARWLHLEAASGRPLLDLCGSLDIGAIDGRRAALEKCEVGYEIVSGDEIQQRFHIAIDPGSSGLFQASGGVLNADLARKSTRDLLDDSVQLATRTLVKRITCDRDAVHIQTPNAAFRARAVVLTVGAWLNSVARLQVRSDCG